MIKALLWDVDGTLLDFRAAESAAIRALFAETGLGTCTDGMLSVYSGINKSCWEKLERGEISRDRMLEERFRLFFSKYGLPVEKAADFNRRYQIRLGDTIVYLDDSIEIIRSLRGRIKQYAVSNGTTAAQRRKLERSGLGVLMDGIFLSEELGVEKPAAEFFDKVLKAAGEPDRREVMIVGDSLTSDIKGGTDAGLVTCWYDPEGKPTPEGTEPDHIISDLHEVYDILGIPEG